MEFHGFPDLSAYAGKAGINPSKVLAKPSLIDTSRVRPSFSRVFFWMPKQCPLFQFPRAGRTDGSATPPRRWRRREGLWIQRMARLWVGNWAAFNHFSLHLLHFRNEKFAKLRSCLLPGQPERGSNSKAGESSSRHLSENVQNRMAQTMLANLC